MNKDLLENKDKILSNIKDNMSYKPTIEELNTNEKIKNHSNDIENIPPRYSYVPILTAIFSNGDVLDLTNRISILQVEMNFTRYIFPLFSLQLCIESYYIPNIQFDDNMEFKLKLLYKSTEENTAVLYNTLFETILKKVKQISSPVNIEEEVYVENPTYANKQILELKLIQKECLNANKILFSGVYRDCSILDTISYMTNKLDNKVFIQQPDNMRLYDQIIFTPNNVFYGVQYLDNYYGIYDRGLKMFYGFNMFRIQSNNWFDETGTNKIKVAFSNEQEEVGPYSYMGSGFYKMGTDNFMTVIPSMVKLIDKRHYIQEVIGTNITSFSREADTIDAQMRNYSNDNSNLLKTKTYINNLNNVNKEKELYNKTVYTKTIEITVPGIIVDVESWFKAFEVNFDSKHYSALNSRYVSSNYIFKLVNINPFGNSGDGFKVYSAIVLEEC